ncbi:MAG: hypothetical protein H0V00_04305 [Chloroflexia bacterium]|nr:hypothetical protein [Chloroflexia bacterium]
MRRLALSLSLVGIVLLGLMTTMTRTSTAQDATPAARGSIADTATHSVAGTWTWVNGEGEETFPSVTIFHTDGSYIEVLPWGAILTGVWQPTGENTAVVTQVINYLSDDGELVQGQGRAEVEVDEPGTTMIWQGAFLSRFQDGRTDIASDADDPGSISIGTRFEPQPMTSLDDLMLTPVPFGAGTPMAGTPTP